MKRNFSTLYRYRPKYLASRILLIILSFTTLALLAAVNNLYTSGRFGSSVESLNFGSFYGTGGTVWRVKLSSRKVIASALFPPALVIVLGLVELLLKKVPSLVTVVGDIISTTALAVESCVLIYCYRHGWTISTSVVHKILFSAFVLYIVVLALAIGILVGGVVWAANGGMNEIKRREDEERLAERSTAGWGVETRTHAPPTFPANAVLGR